MPLSYEVDLGKNLIVVRGEKGLSYDDVIRYQRELAEDSRITPGMFSLVDLRGLTAFEMAGRDVFNLAQSHGQSPFFSSEGRTAVVVSDSTTFAMTRMYMLSRSKNAEPMAIFYDVEEARRWLGLDAVENSPQVIDQ